MYSYHAYTGTSLATVGSSSESCIASTGEGGSGLAAAREG